MADPSRGSARPPLRPCDRQEARGARSGTLPATFQSAGPARGREQSLRPRPPLHCFGMGERPCSHALRAPHNPSGPQFPLLPGGGQSTWGPHWGLQRSWGKMHPPSPLQDGGGRLRVCCAPSPCRPPLGPGGASAGAGGGRKASLSHRWLSERGPSGGAAPAAGFIGNYVIYEAPAPGV